MSDIKSEVNKWVHRGMDRHIRLAVTGLSRAGKTAFITSLVNQLLHSATNPRLPLLSVVRDGRLYGAKRVPQTNLSIPRFAYDDGMSSLLSTPPQWPEPTEDVSVIRLALRHKQKKGPLRLLKESATTYLDIVDYPGEWLLDLPLLELDYLSWSRQQTKMIHGKREQLAKEWMVLAEGFDPFALADENQLAKIANKFTDFLHQCKEQQGLHWVQPGRFVLPGELAGAPVLQFFPFMWFEQYSEEDLKKASPDSNMAMLQKRYEYYQQHVVKKFFKEHFSKFDRQIVLIDCLQPLNAGPESFNDMRQAVEQLMQSFKYGSNSMLKRLFAPHIDRVLFAATKADHVTPEQHPNMVSLLQQLIHEAWQSAAYEGVAMECMSIASIQATTPGFVSSDGESVPALTGHDVNGQSMTMFPGEVPKRLPTGDFWQEGHFDFVNFRPLPNEADVPLPHIRMDKALEFLLGDKFQ
jgi:predicted YcjX-like family ATPase